MTRARSAVLTFILLSCSSPAAAQDIRRIDDRSLTRERHERAVQALLEIEGQKVELVFRRETVPGGTFLTVTNDRGATTYRYLGYDGTVMRFRLEGRTSDPVILTYPAKSTGGFVLIPEDLQYTRLHFELTPMGDRGIVQAALLDNGHPR